MHYTTIYIILHYTTINTNHFLLDNMGIGKCLQHTSIYLKPHITTTTIHTIPSLPRRIRSSATTTSSSTPLCEQAGRDGYEW